MINHHFNYFNDLENSSIFRSLSCACASSRVLRPPSPSRCSRWWPLSRLRTRLCFWASCRSCKARSESSSNSQDSIVNRTPTRSWACPTNPTTPPTSRPLPPPQCSSPPAKPMLSPRVSFLRCTALRTRNYLRHLQIFRILTKPCSSCNSSSRNSTSSKLCRESAALAPWPCSPTSSLRATRFSSTYSRSRCRLSTKALLLRTPCSTKPSLRL